MGKKKAVIALGHQALGTTLPDQKAAVKRAARAVAEFIEAGYQVAIVHSNGPQVSMIHMAMTELGANHSDYTAAPMSVCSAMSQGYIGYDLQNAIRTELLGRGLSTPVCTIITQVTVDPYDDAFYHPKKPIGRYMTEAEAKKEEEKNNYVEKESQGYRRIVAAPTPIKIVELESIRALMEADQVVIACGGGGIPVVERRGSVLRGASAVIEKDVAAAKLAELLDADLLAIITSVPKVSIHYGKANEQEVDAMTPAQAAGYLQAGEFPMSTMAPKVEAAAGFAALSPDKKAIITDMHSVHAALEGKSGTIIAQ